MSYSVVTDASDRKNRSYSFMRVVMSRSLWKKHNPRYLLQLICLPSYSGWFTGERDSINTCILMSMFDRVSEIHVFSENQTMKIIKKKTLLIYCHAKMKMKWQNKYVYSWIITRYTTVTLLLGALYMYTGVFPFLFIFFFTFETL